MTGIDISENVEKRKELIKRHIPILSLREMEMEDKLQFHWPTISRVITQRFGERPEVYGQWGQKGHTGLDFRVLREGTPISSVHTGIIRKIVAGSQGYGNYVNIQGGYYGLRNGEINFDAWVEYEYKYAHLAEPPTHIRIGQIVQGCDFIGLAGNTGFSSGAHLHFSMRVIDDSPYPPEGQEAYPNQYINPEPFFQHYEYEYA